MFGETLLKGKAALVVGGSSESGPAVCATLAAHGADVALTYRSKKDRAAEVAASCRARGVRTEVFPFDLARVETCAELVEAAAGRLGRLDILVNLGGPPPVYKDFRELAEADFDLMMDTHFKGCFFLAREAAGWMERHQGGLVVNVSATSSLKYSHSVYGLAKACVNEMTRFLAHSYAPKVRVLSIVPGMIDIQETDAGMRRGRAGESPLKTIVTPEEIGQLVVAAASPAFGNVTGESIISDGGFWLLHR